MGRPRLHPEGLTATISLVVAPSVDQSLRAIAKQQGITLCEVVRRAVDQYLSEQQRKGDL